MPIRPPFDALPLRKDGPPGNAWGLFGDDDEYGMLNLLTPENTVAAAKEIQDGTRIPLDLKLDSISKPCFGRKPLEHAIKPKPGRTINDDSLTMNTQSTSQWDGFRHYGNQKHKKFFNGKTTEDFLSSTVNGIHAWVARGGIVGRGVLLDYVSWAESKGLSINPFSSSQIPVSTLKQIAADQGVTFRPGDILFTRTGWVRGYRRLSDEECQALADNTSPPAIGLESSEETVRWIWEQEFAAVVGDQPSFEAWPCQNEEYSLHEWLLAGWGLPLGEIFDLERLSEECKRRKRWTFFFSSVPLNVPGGVASPPNGVAIF